jgi:sigma-B regulation protein RsbU (phosphoserine phosphatase)
MLKLIGTDATRYYAWDLNPGKYSIGRGNTCNLAIPDKTISRLHAELEIPPSCDRGFLTDLGSHNGTAVNGQRVVERTEIKPGDHVQFGQAEFRLTGEADGIVSPSAPSAAIFTDHSPDQSVLMSIDEVLRPLPARVADLPELLPTLFDMAKMLVLAEPKESMLTRSLDLVAKIIPADRLAVLLAPEGGTDFQVVALAGPRKKDSGGFVLSRTLVNKILADKDAVLIVDVRDDPQLARQESIILSELKSAMAVPLLDENRVLGILYADTSTPAHRYSDNYLQLFAMVGHIIGSRLASYVLLQERQEKRVYEAELQKASMIQRNLLPAAIPAVHGYSLHAFQEQCRAVGGDLYDVGLLPDGRLVFLVADVSGKGMGAALLMSNILASFRILYNGEQFDLLRAVNRVSMELFKHSASEHFATLFAGLIEPATGDFEYINAGHNSPYLIRNDGRLQTLDATGTVIGIFDTTMWDTQRMTLQPGEAVVVYSDGVTEAGIEQEEYGDERLQQVLVANREKNVRELNDLIVSDVRRHIGNAPRSDDLTLVIVKRDN